MSEASSARTTREGRCRWATAAQRKSLQGNLVHRALRRGNRIKVEKCNKTSWAKLWGRSVGHKAPGLFQSRLSLLAKASGGGSHEIIPTRTTFLSSRCLCGTRKKKLLSERRHTCGCEFIPIGMDADRDEFSAFLALHCQEGLLNEGKAKSSWRTWGVDILLHVASSVGRGSRVGGEDLCLPRAGKTHHDQTVSEGAMLPKRMVRANRQSRSQRSSNSGRKAPGTVSPGGKRTVETPVPSLGGELSPLGTLV